MINVLFPLEFCEILLPSRADWCPAVRAGRVCFAGEKCILAHSKAEVSFHPDVYLGIVCPLGPSCPHAGTSLCQFAHPGELTLPTPRRTLVSPFPEIFYASPTSGEAYRNRQLTTNFEFWVEIFCVPTCFHVRIPKPCLSVCPSVRTLRKDIIIASSISVLH